MKRTMSQDRALLKLKERMRSYRKFGLAFTYPDKNFADVFPGERLDDIRLEYDLLFRAKEIWPYTVEYTAQNEFQRVNMLSDISGFYAAFGLEIEGNRPDNLAAELEFMRYLIFKEIYALEGGVADGANKAGICRDAEKRFFEAHLYEGASAISRRLAAQKDGFYKRRACELSAFLESEKRLCRGAG